jgi:hypothetical protein
VDRLAVLQSLGNEHYDTHLLCLRPSLDVALAWADGQAESRTRPAVYPPFGPVSRRLVYRSVYEDCAQARPAVLQTIAAQVDLRRRLGALGSHDIDSAVHKAHANRDGTIGGLTGGGGGGI